MNRRKLITLLYCVCAFVAILAQAFYYLFLVPKGYVYLWDIIPYMINLFVIGCIGSAIHMVKPHTKYKPYIVAVILILVIVNFGYMLFVGPISKSTVSFHNMLHPMAIKTDGDTTTIYRKTFLLFGGQPEVLNDKVDHHEITWLTKDIAAFIYQSDHKQHVYVTANGDYGRNSYYHPAAELQGTWEYKKQELNVTSDSFTIGEQTYDLSDATEVGTSAVILHDKAGNPSFVIGFGDNLSFTKQGNVKKGSSIVVLNLSDQSFPTEEYIKTSTDFSEMAENVAPEERGKQKAKQMKEIIKQDPTLASFENDYYFVKINDVGSDPRDIAITALQAFDGQGGQGSNCSNDVTLHSVTKTAGDGQDFFLEAKTSETASCGVESETIDFTWYYRVMKTDTGYLIGKTLQFEKGDAGLKKITNPEVLPCVGDQYHYIIQK